MMSRLIFAAILTILCSFPATGDLLITEFMADNDGTLFDADGDSPDWIEIHNPTAQEIRLAAWSLADDGNKWEFPEDSTIEAGDFLVVFASGKSFPSGRDAKGTLHANFKLSADGEALSLIDPQNAVTSTFQAPPVQRGDVSYGITTDYIPLVRHDSASRLLVPGSDVDQGWRDPEFDASAWWPATAAIGFNSSDAPVIDTELSITTAYDVSEGTVGNQSYGGALGMDFEILDPIEVTDLGVFDSESDGLHATITATLWSRQNDVGIEKLAEMSFTPTSPGRLEGGSRFKPLPASIGLAPGSYTIVARGYNDAEPNGNLGVNAVDNPWTTRDGEGAISFVGNSRYGNASFPDQTDGGPENRYAAGSFLFRGPSPRIRTTDVAAIMENQSTTALLRIPFELDRADAVDYLSLKLSFDDGYVVWINGAEVARRHAPEALNHESHSTKEGGLHETVILSNQQVSLVEGTNILALQGLNRSMDDTDFLLAAHLESVRIDASSPRYFTNPTPGGANDSRGVEGFLEAPTFSKLHGFYETPFVLLLQAAHEHDTIRYTTDGTEPQESDFLFQEPIPITTTSVIRARSYRVGYSPSLSATRTFLFPRDVAVQGESPDGYPSRWKTTNADYAMDSNLNDYARAAGDVTLSRPEARARIADSLQSLPALSIVTDPEHLFESDRGIYANPSRRGVDWERPVSAELILPDGGEGFQTNAGLRIMGGTSRNLGVTKKLSMRLLFRKAYGAGMLDYPFFGEEGASQFNSLPLRANVRDSWVTTFSAGRGHYISDQWAKQTQLDMGQPATRGRFVHLYLNGVYWGLYNPTERPDAAFAESYFEGEREDFDVVKYCCPHRTVDGDMEAWNKLIVLCQAGFGSHERYQSVQGNHSNGIRNPLIPALIDVDNFIDYVIHGQLHGAIDWPGNYYVSRDRVNERSNGFRFFTWDNDLAMANGDVNANKVQPDPGHNWWTQSPGVMDIALRMNADYRLRFADHVFQHYFKGALTTERNIERWDSLVSLVEPALYAESARWGDVLGAILTVQDHWKPMVTKIREDYFPRRNAVVLSQLRAAGLYPDIDAPVFSVPEGIVSEGTEVTIGGGSIFRSSDVYYTTDGSDPRLPNGDIRPGTIHQPDRFAKTPLTASITFTARARKEGEWSAVNSATYIVGETLKPPSQPHADDDGDGMNALLEFALGGDDTDATRIPWPRSQGNAFSFQWRRNVEGLTSGVELSLDLKTWIPAELEPVSRVADNNALETIRYVIPETIPQSFVRLRVMIEEQ